MVTPRIDGIDISHWNAPCNWSLIPKFPLISLKATEGGRYRDPTFSARWAAMRARGTKYRGAYHWIRTDWSVAAQVYNLTSFLDSLGGLHKGEFVQLDWETNVGLPVVPSGWVDQFVERVNDHYGGIRTMVYSSDWLPDSTLDTDSRAEFIEWREENPDYPLWYANYSLTDRATGGAAECAKFGADVWQWSSTRIIPGFSGGIDVNQVLDWTVLDLVSAQLIIPTPAPIDPAISATGVRMLYTYIDPNGTVWVGNGLARRALDSMDVFWQYVALSNSGGGPKLISGGTTVTDIANVQHVDAITIEALGKPI